MTTGDSRLELDIADVLMGAATTEAISALACLVARNGNRIQIGLLPQPEGEAYWGAAEMLPASGAIVTRNGVDHVVLGESLEEVIGKLGLMVVADADADGAEATT